MKTVSFLSVAFMATAAIAAPFQAETRGLESTVSGLTKTAGSVVGGTVSKITRDGEQEHITDAAGLIDTLSAVQSSLGAPVSSLKDIAEGAKSGDITKEDAATQAVSQLSDLESILQDLVADLTGAGGIHPRGREVNGVTSSVTTICTEIITSVSGLVTVIGITPQLESIVASVLGLVAQVLALVIKLVPGLVTGLIAGLTPLLAGIGQGLLAPLLTPIAAALAGIQLAPSA